MAASLKPLHGPSADAPGADGGADVGEAVALAGAAHLAQAALRRSHLPHLGEMTLIDCSSLD
jgi:hypothetical protein